MLVLGLETSCDETGVALYDTERGLLATECIHRSLSMLSTVVLFLNWLPVTT